MAQGASVNESRFVKVTYPEELVALKEAVLWILPRSEREVGSSLPVDPRKINQFIEKITELLKHKKADEVVSQPLQDAFAEFVFHFTNESYATNPNDPRREEGLRANLAYCSQGNDLMWPVMRQLLCIDFKAGEIYPTVLQSSIDTVAKDWSGFVGA